MLRFSSFRPSAALLVLIAAPLAAQDVDSIEVTPHDVTRAVTENTGTGSGSCQHFWPWAYDAAGNRVHRQTFVWSLSNPNDFTVEDGGVCARLSQLSDTVTTVVTATIVGTGISGRANFTVTPDPTVPAPPVAAAQPTPRTAQVAPQPSTNPTGPGGVPQAAPDPGMAGGFTDAGARPPGPPASGVTATAMSPTTVRVAWARVADASGYDVLRASNASGPYKTVGTVGGRSGRITVQTVALEDAGVFPKSTVHYQVVANYADGRAGTSATVSATTPPGASATNFTAVAAPASIILSWTAAPGASGYKIQRGDGVFLNGGELITATTYTDKGLPPQLQTYQLWTYYRVAGVGDVEGDLTLLPKTYATPKPAVLWSFRLKNYSGGRDLYFEWIPRGGASYKVLRTLASDGIYREVPGMSYGNLGWVASARDFETVTVGETYLYKLVESKPGDPPAESEVIRVEISWPKPGVTFLTATPGPGPKVILKWKRPTGAQSFKVFRRTGKRPMAQANQAWIPGRDEGWEDYNVSAGTTYDYMVRTILSSMYTSEPERAGWDVGVTVRVP